MKVLLVIPAYNEEESLQDTVELLKQKVPDVDFLIVNDGSTDNTEAVCRANQYPFLALSINLGLAGAFQAGLKYAWRHDYDCVIQYDADGQHLPQYVAPIIAAIHDNDIVIGSRFLTEKKPCSLRMLGSTMIETAIKITTGVKINDPTSGMRAFNKRMIGIMARGINYGPEPDTVAYLIRSAGARVEEVPVQMEERQAGASYFTPWKSIMYMLRMSISILFMQYFRPKIKGRK